MSNSRLGMSIVETRTLKSTANSGQDYGAMMNTIRKDLNWYEDPNEALVVFVPAADLRSGGYGGILGGGWTSGPTSGSVIMPRPSGFTNNVVTHELGHVLGLLTPTASNATTAGPMSASAATGVGRMARVPHGSTATPLT